MNSPEILTEIAWHEAGHAVVAFSEGVSTISVSATETEGTFEPGKELVGSQDYPLVRTRIAYGGPIAQTLLLLEGLNPSMDTVRAKVEQLMAEPQNKDSNSILANVELHLTLLDLQSGSVRRKRAKEAKDACFLAAFTALTSARGLDATRQLAKSIATASPSQVDGLTVATILGPALSGVK